MTDIYVSAGKNLYTLNGTDYYLSAGKLLFTIDGIDRYLSAGKFLISVNLTTLLADEDWSYGGSPPYPRGWETWDVVIDPLFIVTEDWGSVTVPNIQVTLQHLNGTPITGSTITLTDTNGLTVEQITSNNAFSYCFPSFHNNYTINVPSSIGGKALVSWEDSSTNHLRTVTLSDNSLSSYTASYAN